MADDKVNKQIEELNKISRDDGKKEYAKAQYKLGLIYTDIIHNYDKAELFLSNITREDEPNIYANAQFNLGYIYEEIKHDYDKVEEFLSNITRNDAPDVYANAQYNLGFIYYKIKQDYDQVEKFLSNVTRNDEPEIYANAQLSLGYIYSNIKKEYDKAEKYYSNIIREDAPYTYAFAQHYLGFIYHMIRHDYDKAKKFLLNIKNEDAPEVYANAQLNLGFYYSEIKNDYDNAVIYFKNISRNDSPIIYSRAKFELGNIYLFKKNELNELSKYYNQTEYFSLDPYHFIAAQLILELEKLKLWSIDKIKKLAELVIDHIMNICRLAKEIKDSLMVSFDKKSLLDETLVSKSPERRVAHYTRPGVLFNLLKGENPSKFRLNIVDFMNDPSENQVLTQWLNISNNQDNEIKTFLASFSFNHNSLNQFRLYGNEDNIHGSGVSIAFSQDFFGQDAERSINSENINISKNFSASLSKNEKLISNPFKSQNNEISNQLKAENETNTSLHPLSLYRCLYFDPKTEYMSLAKRNKQSFYLEMYNENNDTKVIDKEWQNYINDFKEEEQIKTIRVKMNKIKSFIGDLLKHDELNKISNLEQLISLAVLPISCLIKHAAFEDEDECRLIYITNIADDKIVEPTNYQAINSLYVEYTHVENYIDNIYLGPQCKMQHKLWLQNHFKKKHNGKEIKLIKSEMPLR